MRFRLLGPLEIRDGEDWRGIGAPKWRSVLAALLINAGQIVPADVLINEVWGDTPPAKAGNLISIYVLRLRRLLGDTDSTLLVTRAPGYLLRLAARGYRRPGVRGPGARGPARVRRGGSGASGGPAGRGARAMARQPAGRRPGDDAGRDRSRTAGRAPPRCRRAPDQGRAGLRQPRPGHTGAAQAPGGPSAPGRPVAAAHAGPGRRGPPRRGARCLRAGAHRHRRRARRRSRCRAAPALCRHAGQGRRARPGRRRCAGQHIGRHGHGQLQAAGVRRPSRRPGSRDRCRSRPSCPRTSPTSPVAANR